MTGCSWDHMTILVGSDRMALIVESNSAAISSSIPRRSAESVSESRVSDEPPSCSASTEELSPAPTARIATCRVGVRHQIQKKRTAQRLGTCGGLITAENSLMPNMPRFEILPETQQ